jgi:hypothetical protein
MVKIFSPFADRAKERLIDTLTKERPRDMKKKKMKNILKAGMHKYGKV